MVKRLAALLIWGAAALFLTESSNEQAQVMRYKNAVQPACRVIRFETEPFTVCRVDPARHDLRLILSGDDGKPLRSFAALTRQLGPDARRVAFAMNAGMYDGQGFPIGLYVARGVEHKKLNRAAGPGNFHMKPNGVFWVDGAGPHVTPTDVFAAVPHPGLIWATQSGPMLVMAGRLHPQITPDGASHYVRNAVGVTASGEAVFVISDTRVSFGKIARLLRDQLGCPDALFLDGYVSSLWDGATGRNDQDLNIGPMVVVLEK
ncbi:MAG: hypothetical protein RL367_1700 [Pseudomonadota bacterium]